MCRGGKSLDIVHGMHQLGRGEVDVCIPTVIVVGPVEFTVCRISNVIGNIISAGTGVAAAVVVALVIIAVGEVQADVFVEMFHAECGFVGLGIVVVGLNRVLREGILCGIMDALAVG